MPEKIKNSSKCPYYKSKYYCSLSEFPHPNFYYSWEYLHRFKPDSAIVKSEFEKKFCENSYSNEPPNAKFPKKYRRGWHWCPYIIDRVTYDALFIPDEKDGRFIDGLF